MKIDIFIRRPGDKFVSARDLNVKCEYLPSEPDSPELIEYDSLTDSYGFDWLPHVNNSFIGYLDAQVKQYLAELGI